MITPQQLVDESETLIRMLNDPKYQYYWMAINLIINELAYVNDGDAPPASQVIEAKIK